MHTAAGVQATSYHDIENAAENAPARKLEYTAMIYSTVQLEIT